MEFTGMSESSLGLALTIATPGIGLNSFGSNGGNNGSSGDKDATELALLDTINHPPRAGGKEDELMMSSMDANSGEAGGGSFITRTRYRKLSKEQNDELEAVFQDKIFINKGTKKALAERLKITLKQVDVWFMNRRSRSKKKQTEEIHIKHKQQVEELTKENERLQRKIEKLKRCNKELKKKLKATPKEAAPPQPSPPSVMLLPFSTGLNTLTNMAHYQIQQGIVAAATLPSASTPP